MADSCRGPSPLAEGDSEAEGRVCQRAAECGGVGPLASESSILHPPAGHGHSFSRHPRPFRECLGQQEISFFFN